MPMGISGRSRAQGICVAGSLDLQTSFHFSQRSELSAKPVGDRYGHLVKLACEEMVGSVDDNEALRLRNRRNEGFDVRARAVLIVSPLDDELGLGAEAKVGQLRIVSRKSQPN